MIFFARFCVLLPLLAASTVAAYAQTSGTLEGTVHGAGGLPAAGVEIRILSATLIGGDAVVVTDDTGTFRFPELIPSTFDVTARLPHHADVNYHGVAVNLARTSIVNIGLAAGGSTLMPRTRSYARLGEVLLKEDLMRITGLGRTSWTQYRLNRMSIKQLRAMYIYYDLCDPGDLDREALERAIMTSNDE